MTKIKEFSFSGFEFTNAREGKRLIHPDIPDSWYDPGCVRINNLNRLALRIIVSPEEIKYWDGRVFNPYYGVGSAMSLKEDFSYGRYVFKAKLPEGKYACPALWLSGVASWPPEIDILEAFNTRFRRKYIKWPGEFCCLLPSYKVETNVHYKSEEGLHKDIGGVGADFLALTNPTKEFNFYTLEWRKESIKIYYNSYCVREVLDKEVLSSLNESPFMRVLMTISLYNKKEQDFDFSTEEFIIASFNYYPFYR